MSVRVGFDALAGLVARAFELHGCSAEVARVIAGNMVTAEQDGAKSHGVFRIPAYLSSLDAGWVNGKAEPVIEDVAPAMLRGDGNNGFALPLLERARPALLSKARTNGIALLTVRNAHHFSAVWPDIEPFAREGFIAMGMINSMASVVPHGGHRKLYGTNPLGFAAPRASGDPLVFDQASSALSNGDVQIAAREGHQLPPDSGVDRDGNPTTDPQAVLDGGSLLSFGGYKGSSIGMMMEIMAAGLAGGRFSHEVDFSQHPGAATPNTAQTYIVIDPGRGAVTDFTARIEGLIAEIHDAGQERLPGDRRYANRREAVVNGLPLSDEEYAMVRRYAGT
jgi:delta1-piperideine-2-carboxylate reductase